LRLTSELRLTGCAERSVQNAPLTLVARSESAARFALNSLLTPFATLCFALNSPLANTFYPPQEFGVDVYIAGHKHYYERADSEPPQITNGAAGNNEGVQGEGRWDKGKIVKGEYENTGFGELSLLEEGDLRWQYFLSETGELFDELVMSSKKK